MTMNFSPRPTVTSPVPGTLYRHGDVLIARVVTLPDGVQKREGVTLAYGEITGHSHRIRQTNAAQLWLQDKGVQGSEMFLEITASRATLVHEEHQAIELPRGVYRVWKQREYRPDAFVDVED
jgi:hypothetical protein